MKKDTYATYSHRVLVLIADIAAFKLIANWAYWVQAGSTALPAHYDSFVLVFALVWWIISWFIQSQALHHNGAKEMMINVSVALGLHTLGLIACYALFGVESVSIGFGVVYYLGSFAGLILLRFAAAFLQRSYGGLDCAKHRFIVIGSDRTSETMAASLQSRKFSLTNFLGYFDIDAHETNPGSTDNLKAYCLEEQVGEIYISSAYPKEQIEDIGKFADSHCIHLRIIAAVHPLYDGQQSRFYDSIPLSGRGEASLRKAVWNSLKRAGFKTRLPKEAY